MGKKILIGLAGPAGVGKDTAADYIEQLYGLKKYALAGPIKDALASMGFAREIYDADDMKDVIIPHIGVSYRKMAQTLGTEWGRAQNPEFWLRLAEMSYSYLPARVPGMVVSDIRFENEAAWVREHGLLIHIGGASRRAIAADGKGHASEAGLARLPGDVVVYNVAERVQLYQQLMGVLEQTYPVLLA